MEQLSFVLEEQGVPEPIVAAVKHAERTDEEWVQAARVAVEDLACNGGPFTSEHLIARVGLPENADARALGSIMRWAAIKKLIEPTGQVYPACRSSRQGGLVREWRGCTPA